MHTFKVDGLSSELRVVRYEGHEAISDLFQFEILVAAAEHDLDFDQIVGKAATLSFKVGDEPRHVNGIVASFEQSDEGPSGAVYHATLVPTAWRLEHRRDSRIFQQLTTQEIVESVLKKANVLDVRFTLADPFSTSNRAAQAVYASGSSRTGEQIATWCKEGLREIRLDARQ